MGRTILLDANVIDQINRGNSEAADALLRMTRAGDRIYISQQAYNELIVNALPRGATANRLLLERLNIQIAPAGPMATRVDVYSRNQTPAGTVLSEPDSLVAAQARAINAELWSFDRAFRTNAAVTNRLGVQVAAESGIPLVGSPGGPPAAPADYRVGYRQLGLAPVEITVSGQIVRRGPPGSPPGTPGTPPSNPGGGGGRGGGGSSTSGRGGLTATVGVADNTLPQVGGPSPRGTAIVGGIQLAFQGVNFVLNLINEEIQARRVREALAQVEPQINRERGANPSLGVLLLFFYRQVEAPPESLIRPGAVFTHLETAMGQTRDEAQQNWARQPALRAGAGPNEHIDSQEVWIPPARPADVTALRTPFPVAAVGTFATLKLQDVEWGGITGFDDEGQTKLQLTAGVAPAEFVILHPTAVIRWSNGPALMQTDIPLVTRNSANGSSLTVVDLDPWMPGNVSAAMVFPANDATDDLFRQGPATKDNLNQLRGYVNFGKVRWVRPEYIRVLRTIR
jgi:predicted nucleic acid-binding protein